MVAGVAHLFELSIVEFIIVLVSQQTALYMIDYWMEWRFVHRIPASKIMEPETI